MIVYNAIWISFGRHLLWHTHTHTHPSTHAHINSWKLCFFHYLCWSDKGFLVLNVFSAFKAFPLAINTEQFRPFYAKLANKYFSFLGAWSVRFVELSVLFEIRFPKSHLHVFLSWCDTLCLWVSGSMRSPRNVLGECKKNTNTKTMSEKKMTWSQIDLISFR